MGSGTSLVILIFALFVVVRTLGEVAKVLAEAIAALVKAAVTLAVVALLLIVLIAGQIGGCAGTVRGGELRVIAPRLLGDLRAPAPADPRPRYRRISAMAWSMLRSRVRQLGSTRRPSSPRQNSMVRAQPAT